LKENSINNRNLLNCLFSAALLLALSVLPGYAGTEQRWDIHNPYATVDWTAYRQYKANFHTHTTMSDGRSSPESVIDSYAALGYAVLSITDHDTMGPGKDRGHPDRNKTTWPWSSFGRDPEKIVMVAVEGNEISGVHHIGSYFTNYGNADVESEEAALEEIGRRGGLAVLSHPGRYMKSLEWYINLYKSYPHLLGLEIYNKGDRYTKDRKTWDAIVSAVIDERPVWGFSNDDMHKPEEHLGRNWNVLLLPDLSERSVRKAMEQGVFFFAYAPRGHDGPMPPVVRSLTVDENRGFIKIQTTGRDRIEWISGGKLIHRGETMDLSAHGGIRGYVRAVIYADDGGSLIGTQPFRVRSRHLVNGSADFPNQTEK
jgi:hypothetical protein